VGVLFDVMMIIVEKKKHSVIRQFSARVTLRTPSGREDFQTTEIDV
jgi:hypothetical protein